MATNMTRKFTRAEVWPVGANVAPGVGVLNSTVANTSPQPGVTLTGSGSYVKSQAIGPYTVTGIPAGGVGLNANDATVALDGAFRFPVAGASNATVKNAIVYATTSGTAPNLVVTGYTLTAGSNTKFGKIDRFIGETAGTECSVTIGVF